MKLMRERNKEIKIIRVGLFMRTNKMGLKTVSSFYDFWTIL